MKDSAFGLCCSFFFFMGWRFPRRSRRVQLDGVRALRHPEFVDQLKPILAASCGYCKTNRIPEREDCQNCGAQYDVVVNVPTMIAILGTVLLYRTVQ
jgi:hypothetical protein